MAYVLTTASSVVCGHPAPPAASGKVTLGPGASKLKVATSPVTMSPVLLESDFRPGTVSGCPFGTPCVKVNLLNPPSFSTKLNVGGKPVVLSTLSGLTQAAGSPPPTYPLLRADSVNQSKLQAV
jgi:hypothetical protein